MIPVRWKGLTAVGSKVAQTALQRRNQYGYSCGIERNADLGERFRVPFEEVYRIYNIEETLATLEQDIDT